MLRRYQLTSRLCSYKSLVALWQLRWRAQREQVGRLARALRVGASGGVHIRLVRHHHPPENIALHALAAAGFGELLQIAQAKLLAERVNAEVSKRVESPVEGVPQLTPGIENHVVVV